MRWTSLFLATCLLAFQQNTIAEQKTVAEENQIVFITQLLEPFGGKIQMPKDWFYRERHNEQSYVWSLSKENPDEEPYITGVKLQYIGDIEEHTGKTPEQFLRNFIQQKKSQVKVLSECAAEEQTFFTKVCLETLEPAPKLGEGINYRIQYGLFWGNEIDWVIIMVQGTTEALWNQNKDIFQVMKDFDVIDMTRFE